MSTSVTELVKYGSFAEYLNLSGGGMQQAQDEAQGGALTGSVGPHQAEDGPFRNLEADAVGRDPAPLEYLGQVGGFNSVDLAFLTVGLNKLSFKHVFPLAPVWRLFGARLFRKLLSS